ncbi:Replication initiator protein A [Granulicella rosea]|uniref:Replication initiator protein A n=1 Tax=Granulicella rosea TaxID=474952 RepID=A0A239M4L2_9BACT|nr:replication initiator protein A [Granulicella rosea]SNT37122.1 Replication initiator protein A [Granulicella rosea]
MPIAVDVDLVRFEKNLLQIGFFGANDARDKHKTSRRVEQIVFRNGHKVKVAAEFRGSEQLGLPSTTDRDKFIALLKIVREESARTGQIQNPIRFSGYRMIQELGLSRNGEIYEEIVRWGKRMTDTTITSEQVVYFAAKKVYSDEVLHVFRTFRRTGSSNLTGGEKQEHYEVVLEDWLIENLNQRYVIPEDFNAYKQLTRPTAKGIFGYLHMWFHASQGRAVEKDYAELCNLLNVQAYPHLSKIKSTMGLALNELVNIKYIAKWDIQPMSTKTGYKIVLTPGQELLDLLASTRSDTRQDRRELSAAVAIEAKETPLALDRQEAVDALLRLGVLPARASQLAAAHDAGQILDTIEYLESQMTGATRNRVDNPAGLAIYSIENGLPIPADFVTSRRRRELADKATRGRAQREELVNAESVYEEWAERQRQAAVDGRYPGAKLAAKLDEIVATRGRTDEAFRRVPAKQRRAVAMQIVSKEIRAELTLPSFEEWLVTNTQMGLF